MINVQIIKKDGRLQEFDEKKIFTSVDNASRDVSTIVLNESDIKVLVADIIKQINIIRKDGTPTSSYEVTGVMIQVLKRDGFNEVIKSFIEY